MKGRSPRPGTSRAAIVLLLTAALAHLAAPASAVETPVTLMVLGETHGTHSMTRSLVDIAEAKGAVGCVCPGDFIYGHDSTTPGAWRDMMSSVSGPMLPAQGNHDWPWSDWQAMFPGGKPYYAVDVNGAQFIALNPEHSSLSSGSTQRTWLEARLSERDPSAMKVLFMHRPWWLPEGAVHPTREFESKTGTSASTMYALMEKHGVDLVVSAHEKNYQHSVRNGVHYLVAGGGGPSFYSMGYDLPGSVLRLKANVVSTLAVTPTSLTLKSYDLSWNKVEEFRMEGSAAPTTPPAPTTWTRDAESFPVRTTGGLSTRSVYDGGKAWNLWANGHIEQGADVARSDAELAVRTLGEPMGGTYPVFTVSVGGVAKARLTAPGTLTTHVVPLGSVPAGASVRVAFVNDARSTTEDRNLIVDTVELRSRSTAPAPAPTTTAPDVRFEHRGGGEWWIDVRLSGTDAARVRSVAARDVDTAWTPLSYRSWGSWAGSVHVEPGHTVRVQATLDDGRTVASCEMTHPAGDCTTAAPAPTTPSFDATFRNARGNTWWVEVDVAATGGTLAGVDARVDGGAWTALAKQSWGSWAKTLKAPTGSTVEFRARSTTGETDASAAYAWPPP